MGSEPYNSRYQKTYPPSEEMSKPGTDLPSFVATAVDNLRDCPFPTPSSPALPALRRVELGYISLLLVTFGCSEHIEKDSETKRLIRGAWHDMWAWVQFLLINIVDRREDRIRPAPFILGMHAFAITMLACKIDFNKNVVRTPGLLECTAQYWAEEVTFGHVCDRSAISVAKALYQLLQFQHERSRFGDYFA